MSNIGKQPVIVPEGVDVNINGTNIKVKGSLGELDLNFDSNVDVLDIVLLVNFVLEVNDPTALEFVAGDVNSDGILNVLDIVQVVNLILS